MHQDEYENGYIRAIRAAGYEVIDYEEFGSYQGDLLVFVRKNGKHGFILESYGSCSGCDAFQAEVRNDTPEEIKEFSIRYEDTMQSYDQALAYAKKHEQWDAEAKEMISWIQKHQYPIEFDKLVTEFKTV